MSVEFALERLGLLPREIQVWLACYTMGTSPASSIAKYISLLRTTTYAILLKLVEIGLVSMTNKKNIAYFFVNDEYVIRRLLDRKTNELQTVSSSLDSIEQELSQLRLSRTPYFPKISIFDGQEGIHNLYRDMQNLVTTKKYLSIAMVGTNQYDLQIASRHDLQHYAADFLDCLQEHGVAIDGYLAQGTMIMEELQKTHSFGLFRALPAGNAAVTMWVIGRVFYVIIYYDIPIGIKIESDEFAMMMQFLFTHCN